MSKWNQDRTQYFCFQLCDQQPKNL